MRGRGLKPDLAPVIEPLKQVAPHAGAWIETQRGFIGLALMPSRPPCGGVD